MAERLNPRGEEMLVSLGVARVIRSGLGKILREIDELEKRGGVVKMVEIWEDRRVPLGIAKAFNERLGDVVVGGESFIRRGMKASDVRVDLVKVLRTALPAARQFRQVS